MRLVESFGVAVLGASVGGAMAFFWMMSQADDMVSLDAFFVPALLGAALGAVLLSTWYASRYRGGDRGR